MVDIAGLFRKLIGSEPAPTVHSAPPMGSYPSAEDAEFARQSGFGYGTPLEPYVQGQRARVIGQPGFEDGRPTFAPGTGRDMRPNDAAAMAVDESQSRNLDLTAPANAAMAPSVGTTLAQAALAANRMPIAALGFDPDRIGLDTRINNPNIAGSYSGKSDSIFSTLNERYPSTPVHESIHRGLEQLRKDPALSDAFKTLPPEEMIVRYLMATQAGNPEEGRGKTSDTQRKNAMDIFNNLIMKSTYQKHLDDLDKAASAAYVARQPKMGPR